MVRVSFAPADEAAVAEAAELEAAALDAVADAVNKDIVSVNDRPIHTGIVRYAGILFGISAVLQMIEAGFELLFSGHAAVGDTIDQLQGAEQGAIGA